MRMQRQGEPRLLLVVGSSGSGKSSLVRAGILPRLDKDRSRWAIVPPFRPMTDSVGELARALNITPSAVYQWRDGEPIPDAHALRLRYELKPKVFAHLNPANDNDANQAVN